MSDSTKNDLEKTIKKINRKHALRKAGLLCGAAGVGYFLANNFEESCDNIDERNGRLKRAEEKLVLDTVSDETEQKKRLDEIEAKYDRFSKVSKVTSFVAHMSASIGGAILFNAVQNLFEDDRKRKIGKAYGMAKSSANKGEPK